MQQWTAYSGAAGDLLTADASAIRNVYDVAVTGLVTAIQEALPDLRREKDAAVLVTNGRLGYFDPKVDAIADGNARSADHRREVLGALHGARRDLGDRQLTRTAVIGHRVNSAFRRCSESSCFAIDSRWTSSGPSAMRSMRAVAQA